LNKNSQKLFEKVRNGHNFGKTHARALHWYHFVRIGVLQITSYSNFRILIFVLIKILKRCLKKSGMAIFWQNTS
jgi:hypothetical protein